MMTGISFKNLIAPESTESFADAVRDGRPLAIAEDAGRGSALFSWDDANRLLNVSKLWSAQTLRPIVDGAPVDPQDYCFQARNRDSQMLWRPDPEAVAQQLAAGAALEMDAVETLTPALAGVAAAFQSGLGAPCSIMVNAAPVAQQPVNAQFQTGDTIVLNLEGVRTWRLFGGSFEHPVDEPGYAFDSLPLDFHEANCGSVEREITLGPGAGLYIPAGRYHDAPAGAGSGLHLECTVVRPTGLDLASLLEDVVSGNALYRTAMPRFDDPDGHDAHFAALSARLPELAVEMGLAARMRDGQRRAAFQRSVGGFTLPSQADATVYRVRAGGAKLVRRGQEWMLRTPNGKATIPAAARDLAEWALGQDFVTDGDAANLAPELSAADRDTALSAMRDAGLLETVGG